MQKLDNITPNKKAEGGNKDVVKEEVAFSEEFMEIINRENKTNLSEKEEGLLHQELVDVGRERSREAVRFLTEARELAVKLSEKALSEIEKISLEERGVSATKMYDIMEEHNITQASNLSKMVGILNQILIGIKSNSAMGMNRCLNNLLNIETDNVEWMKYIRDVGEVKATSIKNAIGTIMFFLAIEERNYSIINNRMYSATFRPQTARESIEILGKAVSSLRSY